MDFKQIQELIKMINKSNIGELTIEEKGFKLTIKQKEQGYTQPVYSAPIGGAPVYQPVPALPQSEPQAEAKPAKTQKTETPAQAENSNYITIKSPMIGTFYRAPGPGKPAFVEVGDEVAPGKVVCIIEAMKLFNEIESEVKGKIVKVLVEDASPVEFDQPLFLVDPS